MSEKLQKVLATMGKGSRRDMEEYIKAGRVSVDGKVATLGDRVEGTEVIRVDGQIIKNANISKPICRVLMYNKPEGQMCTKRDPQGRPTVFDRLPAISNGRWLYVGRLDVNTSGLLLFTTDGELANGLMHPSHEVERVYAVRVFGEVTREHIQQLQTNVELDDGPARFDRVVYVGGEGINQWYNVTLKEGRKREVRRLWEALGLKVSRLKRIKYANLELGKLPQGGWQELNLNQVNELRALVNLRPEKESLVEDKKLSVRESFVKNRQVRRAVKNYEQRSNFGKNKRPEYKSEGKFTSEERSFREFAGRDDRSNSFERKDRFDRSKERHSFKDDFRKSNSDSRFESRFEAKGRGAKFVRTDDDSKFAGKGRRSEFGSKFRDRDDSRRSSDSPYGKSSRTSRDGRGFGDKFGKSSSSDRRFSKDSFEGRGFRGSKSRNK